ncbi:glycosyltransferase [Loktanella sp. TSTF-M6]|uniref:Glycosyltransferase n=1 Tax=Loktanella gaetbuli TaxID=2881335 RepID=A0ABS8BY58_9RHOB|nr:glycosyltransferase [Loktanella gaetbuli]MCB5200673.1 glycosyltransferase [Loktanella gaetbuli]
MIEATTKTDADTSAEKQNTCLVFGITSNLGFALGTFLIGFIKHHPDWNGFVHVFHNGVSQEDQDTIVSIWPDVTFSVIAEDDIYAKCNGTETSSEVVRNIINRYSVMYFAKFACFDLLNIYDKCIWFDVDMVVQRHIPDLWDFEDLAWRPVLKITESKHKDLHRDYADILNAHPVPRPNGGLICVSRNVWEKHAIDSKVLYGIFLGVSSKKDILTGDEMSLMIMASKYKLDVKVLDKAYNCPSASPYGRDAFVVHSIGPQKFWNDGAVAVAYPAWQQDFDLWLEAGGSPYNGKFDASYIPHSPNDIIVESRRVRNNNIVLAALKPFFPDVVILDIYNQQADGVTCYFPKSGKRFLIRITPFSLTPGEAGFEAFYIDLEVPAESGDLHTSIARRLRVMDTPGLTIKRKTLSDGRIRLVRKKVPGAELDMRLAQFIRIGQVLSGEKNIAPLVLRSVAKRIYKKVFSR